MPNAWIQDQPGRGHVNRTLQLRVTTVSGLPTVISGHMLASGRIEPLTGTTPIELIRETDSLDVLVVATDRDTPIAAELCLIENGRSDVVCAASGAAGAYLLSGRAGTADA